MSTTNSTASLIVDLVRPHVREALRQAGVVAADLDSLTDRAAAVTRIQDGRLEILTPHQYQPLDRISWWVDANTVRASPGSARYEDVASAIEAASRLGRR